MGKKKLIATLLAAGMAVSLAACGSDADDTTSKSSTLEIAVTYTGNEAKVFKEIISDFEKESGIKVNVAEYGDDYEATLKTRMASKDLPDVFQTHGWSLMRYKEYLMPLNDEPWVKDYDESALGVIQDSDSSIYVLDLGQCFNSLVHISKASQQ